MMVMWSRKETFFVQKTPTKVCGRPTYPQTAQGKPTPGREVRGGGRGDRADGAEEKRLVTGKVGEGAAEEATLSSRLFSRLQSLTLTRERIQSRSSSRPGAPAGTSPSPPRGLKLLGTGPGPVSLPRPRHPARRGSAQALRGGRGGSVHTRGPLRDEAACVERGAGRCPGPPVGARLQPGPQDSCTPQQTAGAADGRGRGRGVQTSRHPARPTPRGAHRLPHCAAP